VRLCSTLFLSQSTGTAHPEYSFTWSVRLCSTLILSRVPKV
jgi:hypothetical protein